MNRFNILREVFSSQENYLALSSSKAQKLDFDTLIAQFFCPGPFFYYLLDSPSLTFDHCSSTMKNLLGEGEAGDSLNVLINRVHPDDFDYMLKCENYVADFLKNKVSTLKMIKYKISYCVRLETIDGSYSLFLIQNIATQITDDGALLKVMGIHSDINHITDKNNYRLSLTGLDGEPSYLGIDLNETYHTEISEGYNLFSERELQVIRLIGEGLTASKIAEELYITEETVKSHKKNALKKSNCKNSTALVAFCVREGLI
jgi:DNA-binding CsgD family transcriptional regulator